MSTLRQLRNFRIPWITTIALACFGNAFAQASYRVTDLGAEGNDNLGCAMSLNNQGWTEIMAGNVESGQVESVFGKLLNGRALIDVDGFKLDLGTLGGMNSWMNWGEINDFGQTVGFSETDVPDPNGEDICGFGTHLTCRPFLWQYFHMSSLPTLGGNNGEASAINNRGQITGFAETTIETPDARLIGFSCRCCGKTAMPNLFRRWVAIPTGTHFGSTIKAKPWLLGNLHGSAARRIVGKWHCLPAP